MPSAKIKRRIYYTLALIILMLIYVFLYSLFTINRLKNNLDSQVNTRTVIINLKDNLNLLLDAESRERSFIHTGDVRCLQQFNLAVQNINANTALLSNLLKNNFNQHQNLFTLKKLIKHKISFANQLITHKRNGNEQLLKEMLNSNNYNYLMDSIRVLNRDMQQMENNLFSTRYTNTEKSIRDAKNMFLVELFLSSLITFFLMRNILKELTKRWKAEEQLQKTIKELELKNNDLASKTNFIEENENRIIGIMDVLIKTTQLDFSEKIQISERGDELDAIAVGINTMCEELAFHLHQLKESENNLNNAQQLAKIGNWEMDLVTGKVRWSNEMFNIYGYGDERFEINLEKAMERMLPEDAERSRENIKNYVINAQQQFTINGTLEMESIPSTYTIVLPENTKKVVEGKGKIILNKNGELLKMAGTVQDIDEKYKAEQKLIKYNIELERKNKEIEQFAYAASHDLQEPLRSISNFSTLLMEKSEGFTDNDMKEYLRKINGGAVRM